MGAPKIAPAEGVKYMETLRQSQLLHGLDEQALVFVAERIDEVFVRAGEPVILQNEVSDDVFIIESGAIEIVTYVPQLKQVNRLAILKSGQHFSEFSVLNRTTKSASGFATEDTHLLRMSGSSFLEVLNRYPVVARNLVAIHTITICAVLGLVHPCLTTETKIEADSLFLIHYEHTGGNVNRTIDDIR